MSYDCQANELRCFPEEVREHKGSIQVWVQVRLARRDRERAADRREAAEK